VRIRRGLTVHTNQESIDVNHPDDAQPSEGGSKSIYEEHGVIEDLQIIEHLVLME